ncbi:MAG TPA: glycogen debranching enzyme, partial [Gemmataceae bacterium]|nr:glycogen debranching enzyme [Gemmataceae bacterium]
DPGTAGLLATRLCGSADLYESSGRRPRHSINFVTCHDGFTLADLVSYNRKHNEANGEGNRDGLDENFSWNCGVEGPSHDPIICSLRRRQAKNFMATLLLSQGVPMLLAGDEFMRTQGGNNNAWCQDNETSWVDWTLADKNADFLRFVRLMIALRKSHPALRRHAFFRGAGPRKSLAPDIIWHGIEPNKPDFTAQSRSLALAIDGRAVEPPGIADCDFYAAFHAGPEAQNFRVPAAPSGRPWRRVVDTALAAPLDILPATEAPRVPFGAVHSLAPFSLILLVSEV